MAAHGSRSVPFHHVGSYLYLVRCPFGKIHFGGFRCVHDWSCLLYTSKVNEGRIRDKIRSFISIAHDIRTPVTLIKAPLSELEAQAVSYTHLDVYKRQDTRMAGR